MDKRILELNDLVIGYGKKTVAGPFNVFVNPGDLVAVIGKNGSGKSTLFKTIEGSLPPLRGMIKLNGNDISSLTRKELARCYAIVTTERIQAGGLTVEEVVALGRDPYTGFSGRLTSSDRQRIDEVIEDAGIAELRSRYISSLSDGERQKCMIARALAQDTELLILDEPFSFLDVVARLELQLFFKERVAKQGTAALYSTHDVTQALLTATKVIIIDDGGMVSTGTPGEVVASGILNDVFRSDRIVFDPERKDFRPLGS